MARTAALTACCAAAVLVTLQTAGCGGGGDERRIVYNCSANADEIRALEAELPEFRDRTGIDLRLNPFSGEEKLYAMIAAGTPPDVFYVSDAVRDKLAASGALLDLRPYLAKDPFAQRLRPEVLAQAPSADSAVYSIGNWTFTCGVYYNRAAFDAAGVSVPDENWTWDDFARAARALTRDENGDGQAERYGVFIPAHFVEAFETMNHAPVTRGALYLDIPPESREVYAGILGLIRDGAMPDMRRMQALGMQAGQLLESGRVAMLVEGVPNAGLIEALTIRWGVAPLPRYGSKEPRYFRSASGGLAIAGSCGRPGDAWKALTWLIGSASYYQPNPVLVDADFATGWERRSPVLTGTGFRRVWELSEQHPGGDLRYFARFSSWTMTPIMERLQPLLDRLWAGRAAIDDLVTAVPGINAAVDAALESAVRDSSLSTAFRDAIMRERARQRGAAARAVPSATSVR